MKDFEVEVELFKNDEPIDFPEDVLGGNFVGALSRAKTQLDKGNADRVVVYISHEGELINLFEDTAATFDVEFSTNKINALTERAQ